MSATGTLRFTAPSTFAQQYIAPILPEFLAAQQDITLDLRFTDMQFDLIQGSFDLALRNAELPDSSLKGRKLASDTRVLCAAPAYLERHGTPTSPAELETHQWLAFREPSPVRLLSSAGTRAQYNPRAASCRLVIDDGLSQKAATVAGAGISINSLWSVHRELAAGSLVRVLPDFQVDARTALWLVYPKSNVLTAKVRVFIDFLMEKIGRSPAWQQR